MRTHITLFCLLALLAVTNLNANAAVTPDIVVALDGSGNFTKIQDAINAVPSNETRTTVILIKAGLYNTEKLIVPANKTNVTIIGESREQTIISYHIYDCSTGKCPTEDAAKWTGDNINTSATLTILGNGFRAENLTIQNTAGPVGQAQAITVRADKCVFINCDFKGYQDTIYFWGSGKRSYFQNCMVLGRTDYIYGDGIVFFQGCEIRSWGGGWITAPSTPISQAYGYVFNQCNLTYATNSPRTGDDGVKFRLGRPWQNYPKVTWTNCNMTDMVNPLGWGDTWNMTYAATSPDLHLYEYNNTGAGADMSNRANWVGLKAITETEAANYTVQKVMAGADNWDPSAIPPTVNTFTWTGSGTDKDWLNNQNWNPQLQPAAGEIANAITGTEVIDANGGTFAADLNVANGATVNITANITVSYLSGDGAIIASSNDVTLSGKIGTKSSNTFNIAGNLTMNANLSGVHTINKTGSGKLILNANNSSFSGLWNIQAGLLDAAISGSLGNGSVTLASGTTLIIGNNSAFFPKASLKVVNGASLQLNADVTLSEFYIDGVMQPVGSYNAVSNPTLISGTGAIVVGRPSSFKFSGGNWDLISSYAPALMPEAGELVYCEGEMETTSTIYPANVTFVNNKGKLRLRGSHKSTGTLTFEAATRMSYATSGSSLSIDAPIVIAGNMNIEMSSSSATNAMTTTGSISGSSKITVKNTRTGAITTATLVLNGDNANFSGTWDLTTAASDANSVVAIEGKSANAFGSGIITIGNKNRVVFSHASSASPNSQLVLATGAKAKLDASVTVGKLTLAGIEHTQGTFTAASHPSFFEGTGTLTVGLANAVNKTKTANGLRYTNGQLTTSAAEIGFIEIYTTNGALVFTSSALGNTLPINLPKGLYIVKSRNHGVLKISINQ